MSNSGNLTLTDCTVSGNTAYRCGGVFNSGTANLTDCTISGNSSYYGGGVSNYGTGQPDRLHHQRQFGSWRWRGESRFLWLPGPGTATLTDTIVAGNTSTSGASDIAGTTTSRAATT